MNEELYFKDAFTEVDGSINIDVNSLNTNCITSNNNKFSLDSEGNLIVNSIITANSNNSNIDFDMIYPVGSIYFSVNNVNPGTLFGGVWEPIKDRFLLASGDNFRTNNIGGEITHRLTIDEMPTHAHLLRIASNAGAGGLGAGYGVDYFSGVRYPTAWANGVIGGGEHTGFGLENSGLGGAHNNMPPYLVVNVWKRIS